ncbi:MAG: hypothetical protein JWM08_1682 [Candidatus Angelobacter sp.]|nr:hypothetical protein [Candidatus Angelobacter sp.]
MAHPELDALFNTLLPFAQKMLQKYGEFLPFGAIMSSSGEIRDVGASIEGDDYPTSQPLLDLLTETFKTQAAKGELRAAGICYDVLTVPPGEDQKRDAICCGLEHYSGETADVFVPYVKARDGDVQYGKFFSVKRTAQFFSQLPRC